MASKELKIAAAFELVRRLNGSGVKGLADIPSELLPGQDKDSYLKLARMPDPKKALAAAMAGVRKKVADMQFPDGKQALQASILAEYDYHMTGVVGGVDADAMAAELAAIKAKREAAAKAAAKQQPPAAK